MDVKLRMARLSLSLFVAFATAGGSLWAKPVGSNDVARAIGNWRQRRGTLGAKLGQEVKDVRKVEWRGVEFHVVRFVGGGHLIASVDTKIRPVIMFSEGDDLDLDERNPALALIVADISRENERTGAGDDNESGAARLAVVPCSRNENEWAGLLDDNVDFAYVENLDDVRVEPLTKTEWGQEYADGNLCYNYYTPGHYPCGCVATAIAQIMKYFEWPRGNVAQFTSTWTQIDGVNTNMTTQGGAFDWENMPDCPGEGSTELQRRAIGKLTSDVGIVAGMHYERDGSGAGASIGRYVLVKSEFGYSNAMLAYMGDEYDGTEEDFKRVMISNFNAKRPVQLSIKGHSIVGDGYGYSGGTLYYHLNFGWTGALNYWYSTPVSKEDPIGTKYTCFASIVYNIYTNETSDLVILSGRVTDKVSGKAVEGQRVTAYAADGVTVVATAETDKYGIYATLVAPGDYTVAACTESADHRSEYAGLAEGKALRCVTMENKGRSGSQSPYGEVEMGNCSDCDIAMETVRYVPEAEVSVGKVEVGRNFEEAEVYVTAKVVHYGQTATHAKVVVTLTPLSGGAEQKRELVLGSDFDGHDLKASFAGLTAGERYSVAAKVVMVGTEEETEFGYGGFSSAREFVWFDESADSFSTAKWSGEPVVVKDGRLSISCRKGTVTTFGPAEAKAISSRVVFKIRDCESYEEKEIPDPDGRVAVSAIFRSCGMSEVVVWGDGRWNPTGRMFADDDVNVDVAVDLDYIRERVWYSDGERVLGPYVLPKADASVSSISFKGHSSLSGLCGTVFDANLVMDASGTEYATYEAAKAAGVTGALSPLWLSTWNLTGGSGSVEVTDPQGLVAYTGDSRIVKSETNGQGVVTHWYAKASDADIKAGADKYIKMTIDLGLAKAITDASVMKIGDYLFANGKMSFVVEVDDVAVARETVKKLVEVRAKLTDEWGRPADGDIDFKDGKVVVTPNAGGTSGFARVKIQGDT